MKKTLVTFCLKQLTILNFSILVLSSCSVQQKISKSAKQVINDTSLLAAHVGISIYEPATGKYWYNYQGDKFFVPASNTKIPTCYAAMKYLGDSLTGFYVTETDSSLVVMPAGDPTFLHPDFLNQSFFERLRTVGKKIRFVLNDKDRMDAFADGWAWNDYNGAYMPERSRFPMYCNLVSFENNHSVLAITPKIFSRPPYLKEAAAGFKGNASSVYITRSKDENIFRLSESVRPFTGIRIPFKTRPDLALQMEMLADTLHVDAGRLQVELPGSKFSFRRIQTQATDSMLRPLMHNSDNFFAEQSLLMVSEKRLGYMDDDKIIDTILKTDFLDLPQVPRWADGSGLSRYNLFTPQDFVAILHKMKNEFGMERIKLVFPTGGEGTISNYYKTESGFIFAKTGTLSGVVALSGYLYTQKGKLLIFSTLVNNHRSSSTAVRRAVEKFLQGLREEF
jgi:serine-type D-Ala-D-Ala carboxypeptidase/endopeptidase (penicillin-binding protein 4)